MENNLFLRSWNNVDKIYNFNIEHGTYKPIKAVPKENIEINGYIKFFLYGKPWAIYNFDNKYWIQIKKLKFRIDDSKVKIKVSRWIFFTKIVIEGHQEKCIFIDTYLNSLIGESIDPTYDNLDLMTEDFPTWLYEFVKENRKVNR